MRTDTPVAVRRVDYSPPSWQIPTTRLHVSLGPPVTRVTTTLTLVRDERAPDAAALVLDAREFTLESLQLDGRPLTSDEYQRDDKSLTLRDLPARCELVLVTVLDPESNTALEGLYRSGGVYCTQCEAEGFRKITAFLDRPDVLSVFDVSVEGPQDTCPVLLSNGNLIGEEDLGNGRHVAHWHDPHPKPCYLFALVAGQLASIEDRFVSASGREVALHIFTEAHNITRCDFAMASLKAAMRWDETEYGFEYDLERFTIVAVDDFNMGAMENKGLNVFNTRYVLADAESATDDDFLGIESVVAHEYFHNWTGNRITCRDWFQLSLKEGLTVFRDQCFSASRHSATVKRIEDVRLLRARQFPEDAGPMAHPIRPDSYIEINNFYTLTVYEKGAEVIRMLHTLLGDQGWQAGMATYVSRHDGTAATCEDFVAAMEAGSGVDLTQFRRWYSTAGTPVLAVEEQHDADAARYTLTVRQSVPDTPGQSDMPPLHIPLRMGLLTRDGASVPMTAGTPDGQGGVLLDLREREQTFVVENVPTPPVASLLRGFSAPVRLRHAMDDEALALLMACDTDTFNRWEAGQRLATRVIARVEAGEDPETAAAGLVEALGSCLQDTSLDPAFRAEVLSLPSFDTLAEERERVSVAALDRARSAVLSEVVARWHQPLLALAGSPSRPGAMNDGRAIAERRLENAALALLSAGGSSDALNVAIERFAGSANMSDSIASLQVLCHGEGAARDDALASFRARWQENRLVIDKWFAVQALARRGVRVIDDVRALLNHPDFALTNPNRVRALIASLAFSNPVSFHDAQGRGYTLLAEHVLLLDKSNPQLAARLVSPLARWARFDEPQGSAMRRQLENIREQGDLSPDVFEIVARGLENS